MGIFPHPRKRSAIQKIAQCYLNMSAISNKIEDTNVYFPNG
ncbi:hypothetical protein bthur0001_55740 [Bacillus thuringiensis serovar tochigiensis BGSC 4Y1]|nr:hypothetical protein bthur0001_55740 [Bacillus thuringiensis serovar tochigiensis BGSC 4Y1]